MGDACLLYHIHDHFQPDSNSLVSYLIEKEVMKSNLEVPERFFAGSLQLGGFHHM